MNALERTGGAAALAMAAMFVLGFVAFLGVLLPAGYFDEGVALADKAQIIVNNPMLTSLGWMLPYVGWALFMVALTLALHQRLKTGAPIIAQAASAFGLIWAGLIMASGMVATLGIRTVVELHAVDAAQAASVWAAVEIVASALGGAAGEVVGGVWLLLVAWAALQGRELPRALSYFAVVLGVAGVATVFPALEPALFVYGVGLIVWWAWLGILMLRGAARESPTLAGKAA